MPITQSRLSATLDIAEDNFTAQPTNHNAGKYLETLMEYEADGMIGDDTFFNGLAMIAEWLTDGVNDAHNPKQT